ncbi:MAG TPA: putative quinol monooxygenase [Dongiaceae bacterium]
MKDFAILVDFRLNPGAKGAFRRLIDENARASCRDEPGCRRFDVLEVPPESDRIVLYEIYKNRAAFDAHIKTRHFARFNEESASLVAAKTVTEFDLVCEGSVA